MFTSVRYVNDLQNSMSYNVSDTAMWQHKLQPLYLRSHSLMLSALLTTPPLSLLALVFQSFLGCFLFFFSVVCFVILSFFIALLHVLWYKWNTWQMLLVVAPTSLRTKHLIWWCNFTFLFLTDFQCFDVFRVYHHRQ